MDVVERLDSAIVMVEEARGVPLSASCVVHRGELLEILDSAKNSFPEDFFAAQEILRNREAILEEARQSADVLIGHAREEVSRMVEQTEIVAAAYVESQRILGEADEEANSKREEIDSYIDARLATLEVVLNKTLDVVTRGRAELSGEKPVDPLAELSE
jgi:vacuolar-type H+-ATPase subunit H